MNNSRTLIVTIIFIVIEIVLGTIISTLYINQYSFWTSSQSLEQFMATVLLIYLATTIILGTFNLVVIKGLERKTLIRCLVTMIIAGAICIVLFFVTPDSLKSYFDRLDLSSSLIILLGLIIGFNFPIIKRKTGVNNASQQNA